jgi:antitoxin HicB
MAKRNPHIGTSLDEWLEEDGLADEVNALVQKRALAAELKAAMAKKGLDVSKLAKRMGTSRVQVRRLLNPEDDSGTLISWAKAAHAVGQTFNAGFTKPSRKSASR